MKIYNYDADGLFLNASDADENPMESGEYLIPSNATAIATPLVSIQQIAKFDGSAWVVVPDLRGTKYWLGDDEHTITEIGVGVPPLAVLEKPAAVVGAEINKITSGAIGKVEAKADSYQTIFLGANSPQREARFAQNIAAAKRLIAGGHTDPLQQAADAQSMTVQAEAQARKTATTPVSALEFAQWIVAWEPKTTLIAGYIESILVDGRAVLLQMQQAALDDGTTSEDFAVAVESYLQQLAASAEAKFADLTGG